MVTTPLPLIVALLGALLLHIPPPTVLPSVTELPRHALVAPVIAVGAVFTVIDLVA